MSDAMKNLSTIENKSNFNKKIPIFVCCSKYLLLYNATQKQPSFSPLLFTFVCNAYIECDECVLCGCTAAFTHC